MRAACGAAVAALAACGPGTRTAREVVEPFLAAVQAEDLDRLYCLSAGASAATELGEDEASRREAFREWASERLRRYLEGREAGRVELDGDAIPLVKLFALGKGVYYTLESAEPAGPDGLIARMRVRFAYAAVDLNGLSPGTTLYFCGSPPGRVFSVVVPAGPGEETLDVLDTVDVLWRLVRQPAAGGCAAGWAVAGAAPEAESATSTQVTWAF